MTECPRKTSECSNKRLVTGGRACMQHFISKIVRVVDSFTVKMMDA